MNRPALRVSDIIAGGRIEGVLLLTGGERRTDRNGNDYWQGTFKGIDQQTVVGRYFRPPPEAFDLAVGEPLLVGAGADTFRDQLNLKITSLQPVDDPNLRDEFVQASRHDRDSMVDDLKNFLDAIEDPQIGAIVAAVLARQEVAGGVRDWPAAKIRHHSYVGGLIEHALEMLELAQTLCDVYPGLRRDLVYAGCILHDLGKLVELAPQGAEFVYSAEGSLVGHIAIADRWVAEACAEAGAAPELTIQLRHLVLSHHGERANGAPVEPATAEAMALHLLDYLSSQMRSATDASDEAGLVADADGMSRKQDWRFKRYWFSKPGT